MISFLFILLIVLVVLLILVILVRGLEASKENKTISVTTVTIMECDEDETDCTVTGSASRKSEIETPGHDTEPKEDELEGPDPELIPDNSDKIPIESSNVA